MSLRCKKPHQAGGHTEKHTHTWGGIPGREEFSVRTVPASKDAWGRLTPGIPDRDMLPLALPGSIEEVFDIFFWDSHDYDGAESLKIRATTANCHCLLDWVMKPRPTFHNVPLYGAGCSTAATDVLVFLPADLAMPGQCPLPPPAEEPPVPAELQKSPVPQA